jgi:hypothetical protein
MATTKDAEVTKAILNYTSALHRLRDAEYTRDVAEMVARTRDATEILAAQYEVMNKKPPPRDAANDLYASSALLGQFAIIFVSGPVAPWAVGAGAGASILVGAGELVNLWKEHEELKALDQNASDRNRMRVELTGRLTNLQQQHEELIWAVQHAGPANAPR